MSTDITERVLETIPEFSLLLMSGSCIVFQPNRVGNKGRNMESSPLKEDARQLIVWFAEIDYALEFRYTEWVYSNEQFIVSSELG